MEHSTQCAINFLKYQGNKLQWTAKWMIGYCPICHGTGYNPQFPENYCLCVLDSKCPRCGALAIIDPDEGVPCYSCGWDLGANEGDVMPEQPICTCVEERCEHANRFTDHRGHMWMTPSGPDDDFEDVEVCADCWKDIEHH